MPTLSNVFARYAAAIVAVALALALTTQVSLISERTPFALFFAAVIVVTWLCGRGPGLVALVLSAVACDYFVIPPLYAFVPNLADAFQIVTFSVIGLSLVMLISILQKREHTLRLSETRYRKLFEHSPDGIVIADPQSYYLDANETICKMLGYEREEFIGLHASDILVQEEAERVDEALETIKATPEYHREWVFKRKDGSIFAGEVTATVMPDGNILGVIRDISERVEAEANSARLAAIVESSDDAIIGKDLNSIITSWNNAAEDLFGYTAEEMEGKSIMRLIPADRYSEEEEILSKIRNGENIQNFETIRQTKSGTLIDVSVTASPIRNAEGDIVGVSKIARDITRRKNLEDQFRQAQKMEAVGRLAGGVAHDFNNLLTVINGYSELTLRKIAWDDPSRRNIEEIREAGNRAAALTGQLLAFSRKQVLNPRVLNINDVIGDLKKMLRRLIKESIELRTVLQHKLGNIKADPGQIEQVIVNLALNARDAMPDGGMLTIETENIYIDEDYVDVHITSSPGLFVRLTITDTGEGMDEAVRTQIFEPFFTTKAQGKGTGLGLATVHGVVKQSGGNIHVYSEVGYGTTFKLYFPCVDEGIEELKSRDEVKGDYSGTETILLVEDENIVRDLVREVLVRNGYKVLDAASGMAALEICETYREPIQLMLTDVIMPAMGGTQLRYEVQKYYPDIRILFMSGYTDEAISGSGTLTSGAAFIEKPFAPDELTRKIRSILDL